MPVSINLNLFWYWQYPEDSVVEIIKKVFPLKPKDIITVLDLQKPSIFNFYLWTFWRDNFSWEKTDKVEEILKELKK